MIVDAFYWQIGVELSVANQTFDRLLSLIFFKKRKTTNGRGCTIFWVIHIYICRNRDHDVVPNIDCWDAFALR